MKAGWLSERQACRAVSLNRYTFREDVLDAYLFDDLDEVHLIAEHWLEDYNSIRPHKALQGLSSCQYAIQNA